MTTRVVIGFVRAALLGGALVAVGLLLLIPPARAVMGATGGEDTPLPELGELPQRSLVYARDGTTLLAALHSEQNRSPVPLERVPEIVINAVLDVEDERFWDHGGVDIRSTLRALQSNVAAGSVRQGGSTITQQLIKNALLTPERSLSRKVKEAALAVRLENELAKRDILERYLNTVFFGNGAYGVQAAAETYFNTNVESLDAAQAALLSGLIHDPVGSDPLRFPDEARANRDFALDRMVAQGHLGASEAANLKDVAVPDSISRPLPQPNDYFVEEVKQRLLDDRRLGETAQERYRAVFEGGLKIVTTLDPRMQSAAEAKIKETLPETAGEFTAALVSVDPTSGAVRALVGGPGFEQLKYNIVTQGQGRQPGSAFKPFVLVAALEAGYGPRDTINGTAPCTFTMPPPQEPWVPGNYEGSAGGVMTITEATARSVNCAYARLGLVVGVDKVADVARRMGITRTKLPEVPSMALGSTDVHPLDMATAYATLANDGVRHTPYVVERVEDRRGEVVLEGRSDGERALAPQLARAATSVLRAVVDGGTGTRARLPGRQVAGKTGTSQEHQNAWFVGYTPQLATAVWMGSPRGNVPMTNVGGIKVTGGSYPARIWGGYMAEALKGAPIMAFPPPDPRLFGSPRYIDYKDSGPTRDRRRTPADSRRRDAPQAPDRGRDEFVPASPRTAPRLRRPAPPPRLPAPPRPPRQ